MKKIQPHLEKFVKKAKKYGAFISMDTNWDPDEKWDHGIWKILPLVDIFMPNENELLNIAREKRIADAVSKIQKLVKVVVVKKGPGGADAYAQGKKFSAKALDLKVADTVGAGDSFDAGFLYGFLNGWSLERSLWLAAVCGSLSTRAGGGTAAQPTLEEAMRYFPLAG